MHENNNVLERMKIVGQPVPGYEWLYNFYSFLDTAADGYCIINLDNDEEYISDKICAAIGYTREQLGKTIEELRRFVVAEDFEFFAMQVRDLVGGKCQRIRTRKVLLCANGAQRRYNVTGTMHHGHVVTIWNEITQ